MLITIDRNIFNMLQANDEVLAKNYVMNTIIQEDRNEALQGTDLRLVTDGIYTVISKNERTIAEVGLANYYNNKISLDQFVSGFYYSSGTIVIVPFDWGMADENDDKFEYTFTLARNIS